jgi:alpha-tubulin suppressor-like RCC1 family protein
MNLKILLSGLIFLLLAGCGFPAAGSDSTPSIASRGLPAHMNTPTRTPTPSPTVVPSPTSAPTVLLPTVSMPSISPPPAFGLDVAAVLVAAGPGHTCVTTTAGGVKCWGKNDHGQLGDGTTADSNKPVDVTGLTDGVKAVAAGGSHTCVLTNSGSVKCWGANDRGQLGNGTTADSGLPAEVQGLSESVSAIAAGMSHTCAVTFGGVGFCWGANESGQLGDGTTADSLIPVRVDGQEDVWKGVAAGRAHTCALTTPNGVKCWGANESGQLGDGKGVNSRALPVNVIGLGRGASAIAAGGDHTCALMATGGVKCWGDNRYGQLGDGTHANRYVPVDLPALGRGVSAVAAGSFHSCAVAGGAVKCWGWNYYGQLGDGTKTTWNDPVVANGVPADVSSIAAGDHACAVTGRGGVLCWGRNVSGQLGDGTTFDSASPVDVLAFHDPLRMSEVRALSQCESNYYLPLVAFSPDSGRLACIATSQEAVLWRLSPWQEEKRIFINRGDLDGISFSPDGKTLLLASFDNSDTVNPDHRIILWDLEADRELAFFPGMQPVAFSPDGKRIAVCSEIRDPYSEYVIEVWNLTSGEKENTLRVDGNSFETCEALSFSPDGKKLAGNCFWLRMWDLATGNRLFTLDPKNSHHQSAVFGAFSPDGKSYAYVPESDPPDRVDFVDAETGQVLRTLSLAEGSEYSFSFLFFLPGGGLLAVGGPPGVTFWDLNTLTMVHAIKMRGWVHTLAVSPDGRWMVSEAATGITLWGVPQ